MSEQVDEWYDGWSKIVEGQHFRRYCDAIKSGADEEMPGMPDGMGKPNIDHYSRRS